MPNISSQYILKFDGTHSKPAKDHLAVEEPLEFILNGKPLTVTMRTPGNDFELAAGFLLTENIIKKQSDLRVIRHCCVNAKKTKNENHENKVEITLKPHVSLDTRHLKRNFYTTSSCGICGKATIEAIRVSSQPLQDKITLPIEFFYFLPDLLKKHQTVFHKTGGLHAAALFNLKGKLEFLREDVGRHNAVDKVIGAALLNEQFPLSQRILLVSGRSSFEIMQKAIVARIPIVCAVSAPSSLAVELAKEFNATLIGFLRGNALNIYAGEQRVTS